MSSLGAYQFQQGSLTQGHLWSLSPASPACTGLYLHPGVVLAQTHNAVCFLVSTHVHCVHAHSHTVYWQKMLLELADFIEDFGQKESGLYNRNSNHFSLTFRCHKPFDMPCQFTHLFLIYTLPSSPIFFAFLLFQISNAEQCGPFCCLSSANSCWCGYTFHLNQFIKHCFPKHFLQRNSSISSFKVLFSHSAIVRNKMNIFIC